MGATRGSNEELSGNTAKQTKRQTGTEALVGAMERSDVSNWQRVRLRARQGGGKQQFERRNKGAPAGGGQVEEGPTERGERRQERRFGGVGQVEGGPTERGEVACLAEVELCEGKYGVTLEGVTEEGTSPEAGTGVDPPLRPSCGNPNVLLVYCATVLLCYTHTRGHGCGRGLQGYRGTGSARRRWDVLENTCPNVRMGARVPAVRVGGYDNACGAGSHALTRRWRGWAAGSPEGAAA